MAENVKCDSCTKHRHKKFKGSYIICIMDMASKEPNTVRDCRDYAPDRQARLGEAELKCLIT